VNCFSWGVVWYSEPFDTGRSRRELAAVSSGACEHEDVRRHLADAVIIFPFSSQFVEVRHGVSPRLELNKGDGHHLLEMFQPAEKS
jgi:hypothetical protein